MGKTLLLADDSVTIQKVVGISFASEDIMVVTVDNGDDAIVKARELRPDVVLADVVMPGKSGYEVCQSVKADPSTSHVPVLLLTGTFEPFDEEHAEAVGAAGHIAKPFEAQTLVDQVNELLSTSQPPAPAAGPPATDFPREESDRSFDFFDDVSGAFAVPQASHGDPAPDAVVAAVALDDIGSIDAFAFGDEELEAPQTPRAPSPAPLAVDTAQDATVTIMLDEATGQALPEAVLDPSVPDSLAVSSSDLTDDPLASATVDATLAPEPPAIETAADALFEGDPFDPVAPLPDISGDPLEDDLEFAEPLEADLLASPRDAVSSTPGQDIHGEPVVAPAAADLPATWPDPEPEPSPTPDIPAFAPTGIAEPLDEAGALPLMADAEPLMEPEGPLAPAPGAVIPSAAPDTLAADAVARVVEEVSPALQQELHQTLERIAWESFGSVTEQVVAQAVERIERVAWEVVPKLAETLIQEEIRKLKGRDA